MRNKMSSETDVQHQQDNHDKKPTLFSTLKGAFFKAIFVLGSAFLVFESTRNSLTYHVGKLWGGVGDVWQELWEKVLSVTGKQCTVISNCNFHSKILLWENMIICDIQI